MVIGPFVEKKIILKVALAQFADFSIRLQDLYTRVQFISSH